MTFHYITAAGGETNSHLKPEDGLFTFFATFTAFVAGKRSLIYCFLISVANF
jgi:hypothetical protein